MAERPGPVTVGELVSALKSYPSDALVFTYEAGTGMGAIAVLAGDAFNEVWAGVTSEGNWHGDEGDLMHEFFANNRPKGVTDV